MEPQILLMTETETQAIVGAAELEAFSHCDSTWLALFRASRDTAAPLASAGHSWVLASQLYI